MDDENDAIEGILNQYRLKMIRYHQRAKDFIDSRKFDDAVVITSSGRGEMQYAKLFINLFFKNDQKGDLIRTFEYSDTSLGVLMERINGYLLTSSFVREKSILTNYGSQAFSSGPFFPPFLS